MRKKINEQEIVKQIIAGVESDVYAMAMPAFVPSGVQDYDMIKIVGENAKKGRTVIINIQCNNKQGKTAAAAVICRNIFWENDKDYFDYPIFKEWFYTNDEYDKNGILIKTGPPIKRFRIIGTAENTSDSGPIKTEIRQWWPSGRYTTQKGGKTYSRHYETDTGWYGDVMTFEQKPKEFEGPFISFTWIDEPAKAHLMGSINSRHSKGGIILITQTPIGAGPMLDVIDDLREGGSIVLNSYSSIDENSVTTGKINHKGTKRGLMTDEEIKNYKLSIPENERPARLYGKNIGKSGKIYPRYSDMVHVKHYELDSKYAKLWNCYCIFDPHQKYYPFLSWWAITPPDRYGKSNYVCYNEWPTVNTLAGYYDQKRNTVECHLTPGQISQIIKIQDGTEYGLNILGRVIDPLFERNTRSEYSRKTEGIRLEYQQHNILFEMPKIERIEAQRTRIQDELRYDEQLPVNSLNRPHLYLCPWVRNMRRSFERHYWIPDEKNEGIERESEQYKDPIDTARMFFAFIKHRSYREPAARQDIVTQFERDDLKEYFEGMPNTALG